MNSPNKVIDQLTPKEVLAESSYCINALERALKSPLLPWVQKQMLNKGTRFDEKPYSTLQLRLLSAAEQFLREMDDRIQEGTSKNEEEEEYVFLFEEINKLEGI